MQTSAPCKSLGSCLLPSSSSGGNILVLLLRIGRYLSKDALVKAGPGSQPGSQATPPHSRGWGSGTRLGS